MNVINFESKKGITLVSLVVTIIVLLIIAGISLNLVMGEGGILTKSVKANKTYIKSVLKEQVSLAYNNYKLKKVLLNENVKDIKEEIKDDLEEVYGEDVNIENDVENDVIIIKANGEKILLKAQGIVEEMPEIGCITKDNYGDYIDLGKNIIGSDSTSDDWRILYNDTQNSLVYIILADFLPNSTGIADSAGFYTSGAYGVYSNSSVSDLLNLFKSPKLKEGLLPEGLRDNPNINVEGALTVDVLTASYNEKHGTDFVYGTSQVHNYLYADPNDSTKGADDLYVTHYSKNCNAYNKCIGYYTATDDKSNDYILKYVYCPADVRNTFFCKTNDNYDVGIRPIVIMSSNCNVINRESDGETIWTLVE